MRRRQEFQRVYRLGVRAGGRYLVVFALVGDRPGGAGRVGVTASRRVGGAVTRARCKRRLRELYRTHPLAFSERPVDLVLNARVGCAAAPWGDLVSDYRRCAERIRGMLGSG